MKEERKYKSMIWAIVILALLNISTIATVLYNRNKSSAGEVSADLPELVEPETTSIAYSGRYFRDRLNLSRFQMAQFVQFNPVFRQQARNINTSLKRVRNQMLSEMAARESDKSRLSMLADSIGILHSDLKKITNKYYLDIKAICSPEQQEKLEQMFNEIFTGTALHEQNKIRGPAGRGYGRRLNNFNN
jgi:Spy/CpxP family protein refolding chaperone